MEFRGGARRRGLAEGLPQGSDPGDLQRGGPARAGLQAVSLLGVRVPGGAGPGRQRQRGGDPAPEARERGLGARRQRARAGRTELQRAGRVTSMRTPTPAQLLQVWERGDELSATARSLLLLASSCEDGTAATPELVVSVDGQHASFRLPDSNDLLALERCADAGAARRLLVERCLLTAGESPNGGAGALSAALQAELAQAMARADPQADLQLDLRCPECAHDWQPPFDIARFLWQELHAWALHMLREVDTLAQAYHWAEVDILGLSPRRRQAYLELCAS